jgi:plastocyanin
MMTANLRQRMFLYGSVVVTLTLLFSATGVAAAPKSAKPHKPQLSGRVIVTNNPKLAEPMIIGIDTKVCGTLQPSQALMLSKKKGVANAVVSLVKPPEGVVPPELADPIVGQHACVFTPRVVVVKQGGTVKFGNSDPVLHNVRVVTPAESMNKVPGQNLFVEKKFTTPGIHPLRCDFHYWMKGFVVVAEHPYYAVTDAEGRFAFDVPPGKYDVKVWHEALGVARMTLEVGKPLDIKFPENFTNEKVAGVETSHYNEH